MHCLSRSLSPNIIGPVLTPFHQIMCKSQEKQSELYDAPSHSVILFYITVGMRLIQEDDNIYIRKLK